MARKHQAGDGAITMMTTYDYPSAILAQRAGYDVLLVGDSLGNVVLGYDKTTAVSIEDMIHHCKAVVRGCDNYDGPERRPLVVGDMPFGTFRTPDIALENAVRLVQEGGADVVKIEGGIKQAGQIAAVVDAGIPVMGHIGLTPQTATALGGFRSQGHSADAAVRILEDAMALKQAGCFSFVMEFVPRELASDITRRVDLPTIGIGAGNSTSGQVLVFHDVLGMYDRPIPSFARKYADAGKVMADALAELRTDFEDRSFPGVEHSKSMKPEVLAAYQDIAEGMLPILTPPGPGRLPGAAGSGGSGQGSKPASVAAEAPAGHQASVPEGAVSDAHTASQRSRQVCGRRVAVIGGGAMGSLLAGRLASVASNEVFLVTKWGEHLQHINRHGLQIDEQHGRGVFDVQAVSPDQLDAIHRGGPVDLAIIAVKGPATKYAVDIASQLVCPSDGTVLSLQNGMGNVEVMQDALPEPTIVSGVTNQGATLLAPGVIRHTGLGTTYISRNSDGPARAQEILASSLLLQAGFPVEEMAGEGARDSMLWGKLLVNSVINPLTALLDVRNGELLNDDGVLDGEVLASATAILDECCSVADALEVQLPFADPVQRVTQVMQETAGNVSSMLADVRRGVPTEVDNINGYVVAMGQRRCVPTPCNEMVVSMVKARRLATLDSLPGSHRALQRPPAAGLCTMPRRLNASPALAQDHTSSPDMHVWQSVEEFRPWRREVGRDCSVAFVPTMGGLHAGHLALVEEARREADIVVSSLFVNPAQFTEGENFDEYPRTTQRDLGMLGDAGVDAVLMPQAETMYPRGEDDGLGASVLLEGSQHLGEGSSRPHFFHGVATVVAKLFNVVQPTHAYFGQKDAEQCAVIRSLVRDMLYDLEVVVVATVRERDGLAMSTRNELLDPRQRAAAPLLYFALQAVEEEMMAGERDVDTLVATAAQVLRCSPDMALDYVRFAEAHSMARLQGTLPSALPPNGVCVSAAARLGEVRLIDNLVAQPEPSA